MDASTDPATDVGLILLDLSLQPIAFDQGALAILKCPDQRDHNRSSHDSKAVNWIPKEIVKLIRGGGLSYGSSIKLRAPMGGVEYLWRIYLLETQVLPLQPIVALHLEKCSSANAIDEVAAKYDLTEREQQLLSAISTRGLTNKELAQQMNISPLTVKAFLRLIMLKMGTTTRAGVVAKILHRGDPENANTFGRF